MDVARQLVRSFVPIDGVAPRLQRCEGNPCLLLSQQSAPLEAPAVVTDAVQCQSWRVSHDGDTVVSVRCYGADRQLIQCCGHGLLAAAHTWQRRLQRGTLSLLMNGSLIPSWSEGDVTWLRFAQARTQEHRVPEWLQQVFRVPQRVHAAAIAGEANGYMILQWPDGFDLRLLSRPATALAEWTERALICTSARPDWGDGMLQMRYFAPQYGVEEDAATGSAMRVLAQYWSNRFKQLTAYQCSPAGGLLLARHTATHVEVGGRCLSTSEGVYD